jgi:hypothetical protein
MSSVVELYRANCSSANLLQFHYDVEQDFDIAKENRKKVIEEDFI